jgi:hypothetical protein
MTQYLVAIHHPDDYDPFAAEDAAMHRDIDVLNDEMKAAGVRVFVGGLQHASSAKSLGTPPHGKVLISDGPYGRPRSTSVVSGCWKPLTWTRRWRGGARPPSPVGHLSRCARFIQCRMSRRNQLSAIDATQIEAIFRLASLS